MAYPFTPLGAGERYGRLTVVGYVPVHERPERFKRVQNTNAVFEFMCDCGQPFFAVGSNVSRGRTQSCGCLRADRRWPDRTAPIEVENVVPKEEPVIQVKIEA